MDGRSGNIEPSDIRMTSILALVRLRLIELILLIDPAQLNAPASLITLVQFALQKYQPPHEMDEAEPAARGAQRRCQDDRFSLDVSLGLRMKREI
jgi:hypothetical protein